MLFRQIFWESIGCEAFRTLPGREAYPLLEHSRAEMRHDETLSTVLALKTTGASSRFCTNAKVTTDNRCICSRWSYSVSVCFKSKSDMAICKVKKSFLKNLWPYSATFKVCPLFILPSHSCGDLCFGSFRQGKELLRGTQCFAPEATRAVAQTVVDEQKRCRVKLQHLQRPFFPIALLLNTRFSTKRPPKVATRAPSQPQANGSPPRKRCSMSAESATWDVN